MSTTRDEEQALALSLIALLVATLLAGVIGFAVLRGANPPSEAGVERVFFQSDDDALPAESLDVLARVADAARADAQVTVLISGVRDPSGDTARAHRRAVRVRHALEADGVPASQLLLGQPLPAGRGNKSTAGRVEIRLQ